MMTTASTIYDELKPVFFDHILIRPAKRLLTTQYAKDIVSGKLLASKKVQQACRRHLNDLKRQGTRIFLIFLMKSRPPAHQIHRKILQAEQGKL